MCVAALLPVLSGGAAVGTAAAASNAALAIKVHH